MANNYPGPEKFEISFNGVRNGDRLGHDHLDSAELFFNRYRLSVNETGLFITLPVHINTFRGAGGMYSESDKELNEQLIFTSMGQVMRVYRF